MEGSKYFAFITDQLGRIYYFSKQQRDSLKDRLEGAQWNSHSYIAMYYCVPIDLTNKYLFDTNEGIILIQLNVKQDIDKVIKWTKTNEFNFIRKTLLL